MSTREIANLLVRVGADISRYEKQMNKAARITADTGRKLTNAGQSMTIGFTVPLAAAGWSAIKFGMDAVESENLFTVSMGKMADSARAWSEQLRDQFGLNEYETRKQVGMFYTMFESMQLGERNAYKLSTGLTQLAYDMGSFYDLPTQEAFEKLSAGITGETEPLKRLGILVDEETTKQYAYAAGIAQAGEKLTQQQKVMARYVAIMEQTKKAQGDLGRTLDSPTNQLRIMQSELKQVITDFGMGLMPLWKEALAAGKPLVATLRQVTDWFLKLDDRTRRQIVTWGLLAAAAGPVVWALGGVATGLSSLIRLGPMAVGGVKGLIGGFQSLVSLGGRVTFALHAVAGGAATVGEAFKFVTGVSAAVAGAWAVAIALGYLVIRNWDTVTRSAKMFYGMLSTLTKQFTLVWELSWMDVKMAVAHTLEAVHRIVADGIQRIARGLQSLSGIPGIGDWADKFQTAADKFSGLSGSYVEDVVNQREAIRKELLATGAEMKRLQGELEWYVGETMRGYQDPAAAFREAFFGKGAGAGGEPESITAIKKAMREAAKEVQDLGFDWDKLMGQLNGGSGGSAGGAAWGIVDAGLVAARQVFESARAIGNTVGAQTALSIMDMAGGRSPAFAGAGFASAAAPVQLGGVVEVVVRNEQGAVIGRTAVNAKDLQANQHRYSPAPSKRRGFKDH